MAEIPDYTVRGYDRKTMHGGAVEEVCTVIKYTKVMAKICRFSCKIKHKNCFSFCTTMCLTFVFDGYNWIQEKVI